MIYNVVFCDHSFNLISLKGYTDINCFTNKKWSVFSSASAESL